MLGSELLSGGREEGEVSINTSDTTWMLTSTLLIPLMCLPGLTLFYGGIVRSKNVLSIFVQGFAMAGVISLLWVAFGYAVAAGSTDMMGAFLIGSIPPVVCYLAATKLKPTYNYDDSLDVFGGRC